MISTRYAKAISIAATTAIAALYAALFLYLFAGPARADDRANLNWAAIYAMKPATEMRDPGPARPTPAARLYARTRVLAVARSLSIPGELALAVAQQESGLRCNARGAAGELGPLQIKPATARMIGYRGPVYALNSCEAGVEWGLRHLALAYRRCGTYQGAAGLHNRGLGSHCGASRYTNAVLALIHNDGRPRWARREYA